MIGGVEMDYRSFVGKPLKKVLQVSVKPRLFFRRGRQALAAVSQPTRPEGYWRRNPLFLLIFYGAPNRIRTGVLALRGLCPGPLDDGSDVGDTRRSRAL
jgi:hypothetical protein